uniref:Uncharacterized protein n=1 Tax=Rhodosorus marinus TaxID=101924 RepID=A0A7S3AAP9_9RHOD|mmetsp:Transcript_8266/g.36957  ORF Transcript_8266/g.36957 Transcript_8266/m.36957 type:complete len:336 (+) Transcript_8266:157-1164(+)
MGAKVVDMEDFGVVFDIDGVLIRGKQRLKGGKEAVEYCEEYGVPHVFLTNNAMDLESVRADYLSSVLGAEIHANRMICAHTPLNDLPDEVKQGLVLVTGFSTGDVRDILLFKGFKNVHTVHEYAEKRPYLVPNKLYPGRKLTAYEDPDLVISEEEEKVSAVIVIENSTDWHEDLQVILDVLRSDGRVGSSMDEQMVDIYCCNYDFVFATGFRNPRLGPGAFMKCLEILFKETTGRELEVKSFGKPFPPAYRTTERRLAAQSKSGTVPETIYAIGDNPRSDIAGANRAGERYKSILVRTGVFNGNLDNDPEDPADYVVQNVEEAMDLIRAIHTVKN